MKSNKLILKYSTGLFILLFFSLTKMQGQANWNLAMPTDGSGAATAETAKGICTDASGNIYMVGVFNGSSDFNLNTASTNIFTSSGNDGFVVSYDKDGNYRWHTIITGTGSDFVAPSGAICTNGTFVWFTATANMTGSPMVASSSNTVNITSAGGSSDNLVSKLNCSNGGVNWAVAFGGSTSNDGGEGICVDPNSCCYVIGSYGGTFTMNGKTAPTSGGASDLFISKFSPNGDMLRLAIGGSTTGADMLSGGGGICYVPGATPAIVAVGSMATGSGSYGSFNYTSTGGIDGIVLELDTSLNFTNMVGIGTGVASTDEILGVTYDSFSGGVYIAGYYNGGSVTLPGTTTLVNSGVQDILIARYSISGNNFVWAKNASGTGDDRAQAITADGYGGILVSGFSSSAPCSFGGALNISNTGGLNDLFIARYNTSGTAAWVLNADGTSDDQARGVASYLQTSPSYVQNVYATGNFQNAITFNGTTLNADGGNDFYLARINDLVTPLTATQSQVNLTCNGVCTGQASVVASGGTSPYTYAWSPSGGSGATASSLCATNYTCIITDAASNSITKTFNITQPSAISTATVSQNNVSCFGGSNGTAHLSASGGTGTLTYNWTPGNPTGDGTNSVTGLTANNWTCTVTDANSCTKTAFANITQPTAIMATTSQTNIACFGGNGVASVSTSGGTGALSYAWAPSGGTSATTSSLSNGTYTCTITDANSCSITKTVSITQPAAITANISSTATSCSGNTGIASVTSVTGGTGAFTYAWVPSGGSAATATSLGIGSYTCTITDANSCAITKTITIATASGPALTTASQVNISCTGGSNGSASVNAATGGATPYTYNWTPGNPTGDGTTSVTGLTVGSYTCTIIDNNGCFANQTFNITQPTAITATTTQTNISCNAGSNGIASVSATGGTGTFTYAWSPSGGTAATATGLTNGTYTCVINDGNSCMLTKTVSITQPTAISATTTQTNVSCNTDTNGAASISATGGTGTFTYSWSPSGGTSATASGLSNGSYTCTIKDANLCSITKTVNITQPAILSANVTADVVLCNGGISSVTVTATGGTTAYTGVGTFTATAGIKTYTVTDANGCSTTTSVSITQPAAITSAQSFTLCNDQSVTVGANTYSVAGTFTDVIASQLNGCDSTITTNIIINALPNVTVNSGAICAGESFTIVPNGAATYTYSIGNDIITPSSTDTYTITGTDVNECENSAVCSVTVNTLPNISVISASICAGATGTLTASGADSYTWSTGSNSASITDSPLTTTIYTVNGTSLEGCSGVEVTATITVDAAPAIVVNSESICAGSSATLTANGVTTYAWSTGENTNSIVVTPTINTVYVVTGNLTGCGVGANSSSTVTVNSLPTIIATTNNTLLCTGETATLSVTGTATSYTWSTTETTSDIAVNPTSTTTYTVDGTDANGCSNSTTVIQDVSLCTGIASINTTEAIISVYPNPNNGIFYIELSSDAIVVITNTLGQTIVNENMNTGKHELYIHYEAEGIYFAKVIQNNKQQIIKVIKK